MKLARTVVNAMVVAALGLGAAGLGSGVATAKPGHDINQPCFPFCDGRNDNGNNWNNNGNWNNNDI